MTDGRHPLMEALFIVLGWPWLETLGTIVSALAWPAAVVILVLMLRPQVRALMAALTPRLKHLRKVTGPLDMSAEFMDEVEELEEELDTLPEPGANEASKPAATPPSDRGANPELKHSDAQRLELDRLAMIQPEAAIMAAWKLVERAARDHVFAQRELRRGPIVRQFTMLGSTPDWIAAPVHKLHELRGKATHDETYYLDEEAARSYISSALKMVEEIRALPVPPRAGQAADSASNASETSGSGASGEQ